MSELSSIIERYLKENGISESLIYHPTFKGDLPREISLILEKELFSQLDEFDKEKGYSYYVENYVILMDGKVHILRNAEEFNKAGSQIYIFGIDEKNNVFREKLDKFPLPVKNGEEKVPACHYSSEKRMYDYNGVETKVVFGRAFKVLESEELADSQAKKTSFYNTDEIIFNSDKNRNGFRYTLYIRRPNMITMDIYGKFLNKDSKTVDVPRHIGTGLIDDKHPEVLKPCASLNNAYNIFLTQIQNALNPEEKTDVKSIKDLNNDLDQLDEEEKEKIIKTFERNIGKINDTNIKEALACRMIINKLYSSKRKEKLIKEKIIDEEGNLL